MKNGDMSAFRSTLDKISAAYDQNNYTLCMQLCSDALKDYTPILNGSMKLTLSQFIDECSEKLSDHSSAAQITDPSCSFCGKKPPSVRLGAGPSAFICNECVALFSQSLK
jgi:hypothetical protein